MFEVAGSQEGRGGGFQKRVISEMDTMQNKYRVRREVGSLDGEYSSFIQLRGREWKGALG